MVNKILLCVLVVLIIAGLSMEANAKGITQGEFIKIVECGTFAKVAGFEDKATYYARQVAPYYYGDNISIIRNLIDELHEALGEVSDTLAEKVELAAYAFEYDGCDRPFI